MNYMKFIIQKPLLVIYLYSRSKEQNEIVVKIRFHQLLPEIQVFY
jgi:hypothetical protein